MMQNDSISLPGVSEVLIESEDSQDKLQECKSERHSILNAYQRQIM